jgi:trehalose 6-phosphate phosphatase
VTSWHPAAIDSLVAHAPHAGLVLDFDGVLAPIVADPADSQVAAGTTELLERIARRLGVVAVLSGRPLDFLLKRVPAAGVRFMGSYGLEEAADGSAHVHGSVNEWLPQVDRATARLEDAFRASPGVRVERKAVSVAVHWRRAPDQERAAAEVAATVNRIADETGLLVESGKLVLELLPPTRIDKGTTLDKLVEAESLRTIVYVGDDLADAPAMRAAVAARGHAILVEHGPETPASLRELASEVLHGIDGFRAWLAVLAARLHRAED